MKKGLLLGMLAAALAVAGNAWATEGPEQGAEKYAWHLSGAVMPVPPYGSLDIAGSDAESELKVKRPDCQEKFNIEGEMEGLKANTEYTVYLSNPYTAYKETGWNVSGSWVINVNFESVDYPEALVLSQNGDTINGTSLDLVGGGSPWTIDSGSVTGSAITFGGFYNTNPSMRVTFTGTLAADGSSMSGTWADVAPGTRSGTWASTSGAAVKTHTGDTGWTGQLAGTAPFTFTTDAEGEGKWNYLLDPAADFSVWINGEGGTILISDNVVAKDVVCTPEEDDKDEINATNCAAGGSMADTKACWLFNKGVKGKGILHAPGLRKEHNPNFQSGKNKQDDGDEGTQPAKVKPLKANNGNSGNSGNSGRGNGRNR